MHKRLWTTLVFALAGIARGEVPQTTNYLGTINGTLPVAVSLAYTPARFDTTQQVEGSYLYLAHGNSLFLRGTRTFAAAPKNDYSLAEFGRDAKSTGTFELATAKNGNLTGAWKSPDGKKNLPVSLTPVARTITIISAQSDRYEIRTGYLELLAQSPLASALNAHLRQSALESHNQQLQSLAADAGGAPADMAGLPWSIEQSPCLLYASDGLVSIRTLHYQYTGGAHGNSTFTAQNFAWNGAALVPLSASDLLPAASWPALRDLCIKDLKTQGASDAKNVKFDHDTPPVLNFTTQGMLVTFDPYAVGSFAEGAYVVSLPYATVKPLLPAGTPLAALLPK